MEEEEKIWIAGGNRKIPVKEMSTSHLLTAFSSLADREFETHQKLMPLLAYIDKLQSLKDMLMDEMDKRQVTPIYPDQKYRDSSVVKHYGGYFEAERRTKLIPKAILSSDK